LLCSEARHLRGGLDLPVSSHRFLHPVDRSSELTDFIASIDIGGSAQLSLADTIKYLFELVRTLSRRARPMIVCYSGDVEIVDSLANCE
jgi:hypothetical protein